jgi:hypothetical protein
MHFPNTAPSKRMPVDGMHTNMQLIDQFEKLLETK